MTETKSSSETPSSWLPSGCRRILIIIGMPFVIVYGVLFTIGFVKVTWEMSSSLVKVLYVPVCGLSGLLVLFYLVFAGWTLIQAQYLQRYMRQAGTLVSENNFQAAYHVYKAERDSPEKYWVLATLSSAEHDIPATENYSRAGLAQLKKRRMCRYHFPTLRAQWLCHVLQWMFFNSQLIRGHFVEAADFMRENANAHPNPNSALLYSAWAYFLANDVSNARIMLDQIAPIKYLETRNFWIIEIPRKENTMSRRTHIDLDAQCLIPYLQYTLHGHYSPELLHVRATQCNHWEELAKTQQNPYGERVRELLPNMRAVWDAMGVYSASETEENSDQPEPANNHE